MDLTNFWYSSGAAGGGGDPGAPIGQSLRFRGAQNLSRTPGTAGNRRTWTYSFWWKNGMPESSSTGYTLFFAGSSGENRTGLTYDNRSTASPVARLSLYNINSNTNRPSVNANASYRDSSAWYHVVLSVDTTDGTAANRARMFVNGVQVPTTGSVNANQNDNTWVNSTNEHVIGQYPVVNEGVNFFTGYMADMYFIDGQALQPTSFGRENANGVWVPVDYSGTYGNNGFHLDFADPNDIGKDISGNGNDFTATGFELADQSSSDYDHMQDSPTQNWATLDPLMKYWGAVSGPNQANLVSPTADGNLTLDRSPWTGGQKFGLSTQAVRGRVYAEATYGTIASGGRGLVVFIGSEPRQTSLYYGDPNFFQLFDNGILGQGNGTTGITNLETYASWQSTGDVASVALDMGTGEAWFAVNGVWQQGDPAAGTDPSLTGLNTDQDYAFIGLTTGGAADDPSINFGQQNDFLYTPPDGFSALQTQNMPAAPIANGRDHFEAVTYVGNGGTTQTIPLDFQPDLIWIKAIDAASSHCLYDTIRGATAMLNSDQSAQERTDGNVASVPLGFTVGSLHTVSGSTNINNINYVAWCWRAGGAAVDIAVNSITATTPSIASSVSANTDAGFSIVSYTGETPFEGTYTIGHGLTEAPEFIIVKNRDDGNRDWAIYHQFMSATPEENWLRLNTNEAIGSVPGARGMWGNTQPNNTVFSVGDGFANTNGNGDDMIAYCWHSVPGYSAFGSYTGNGDDDGPFVYTGFRPAFILTKRSSAAEDWSIVDTTRSPNNPAFQNLRPNEPNGEGGGAGSNDIDILSNGFKLRNSTDRFNGTGTYVYACFAENPFQAPVTAR